MTTDARRLDAGTVARLAPAVAPSWRAGPSDVRIAHLGPGAFHRAHQAFVTDLACRSSGQAWGIGACASRGSEVIDQLARQDRLFTVLVAGATPTVSAHAVFGSLGDRAAFADLLTSVTTTVATLTVTEPHYPVGSGGSGGSVDGRLDRRDDGVRQDLADQQGPGRSLPGLLHRGLLGRWSTHGEPLSVLSCDNILGNGRLLRGLVREYAELAGAPTSYLDWLSEAVAFPDSVVDRLTPRPSAAGREEVQQMIGLLDEAAVTTEDFWLWAIEDVLAAPHPPWQDVGATLVPDVRPYEQMKLLVLNGAHTLLAGVGLLLDDHTVLEAIGRPELAQLVTAFHDREAIPSARTGQVDVESFARQVRVRFANPGLQHRLVDIAAQSSSKIPERLVPIAVSRTRQGLASPLVALGIAAWLRLHDPREPVTVRVVDHRAEAVREALDHADPTIAVARACTAAHLLPGDADLSGLLTEVVHWLTMLRRRAVSRAVQEALDG